jgi:hypothetical protein
VNKTVSVAQAAIAQEDVLPPRVQEALGELVGAAREGDCHITWESWGTVRRGHEH